MSEPAPISYASFNSQELIDRGHLKAIAVCHYVWGGLTMVLSCFFIIYIVMGYMISSGRMPMSSGSGASGPPPQVIGYVFMGIGSCFVLLGWAIGILTIISGRCIAKQRRRMFSLVMAGINCGLFPFGTVLGVFSFIVLLRQSVIHSYLIPPSN